MSIKPMQFGRRDFIKKTTGTIIGTSISSAAFPSRLFIPNDAGLPREIERIENEILVLRVFDTGTFAVTMKTNNYHWLPDPWEGIACRVTYEASDGQQHILDFGNRNMVSIKKINGSIHMIFNGLEGKLLVSTSLSIKDNIVNVVVNDVKLPSNTWLLSLDYPFRFFYLLYKQDNGYFALPEKGGCLIPTFKSPYIKKLGTTQFWQWYDAAQRALQESSRPLLPFFGAQKDRTGFTAIVETADDYLFNYLLNSNLQQTFTGQGLKSPYEQILCAWPLWLSQKGKLGYQRQIRFEFSENLDYIGMAKAYRHEAIAKGYHVTLREKEKARPQVSKLAGAPYLAYWAGYPYPPGIFDYTYKQLIDIVDDLAGPMGMKRAFVHFWGAYSIQPPGNLPFDTRPGPIKDLQTAVSKCKDANFLFTLYNDVSAQLEESDFWRPELMRMTKNGNKFISSGRWKRTCSSQYVDSLSKFMPYVVKTLGVEACYHDCLNNCDFYECYDPNHPQTRTDDREARRDVFNYFHSLGLVLGGEDAGWCSASEIEYTNCVGSESKFGYFNYFKVPIFHLVFHDALVGFSEANWGDYTQTEGTSFEEKILRDLLYGIPPMFFINLWDHKKWRHKIQTCYNIMSDPVAAVMYDEMISHEWITEDQMVQRTVFSSGVEVTVNFDELSREGIPSKGYYIRGLKDGERKGHFVTNWETKTF